MLSEWLWILIELVASRARSNPQGLLFGGMQVIYVGDMLQLAPISIGDGVTPWLFTSPRWRSSVDEWFYLEKTVRQRDVRLATILNQLRVGYVTKDAERLMGTLSVSESDATTYLYAFPFQSPVSLSHTHTQGVYQLGSVRKKQVVIGSITGRRRILFCHHRLSHRRRSCGTRMARTAQTRSQNGSVGAFVR
jgi:hypothetical protein